MTTLSHYRRRARSNRQNKKAIQPDMPLHPATLEAGIVLIDVIERLEFLGKFGPNPTGRQRVRIGAKLYGITVKEIEE